MTINVPPNPEGGATFGFVRIQFTPKRKCEACNRSTYVGYVSINDQGGRVVCTSCYDAWDDGPTSFEDANLEGLIEP